jgi:predicted site-specific integrase-resolvase
MGVAEFAALLGVAHRTALGYVQQGRIAGKKITARRIIIAKADVERFLLEAPSAAKPRAAEAAE